MDSTIRVELLVRDSNGEESTVISEALIENKSGVPFDCASISGTIYLNGVEQSVSYLGTTYDGRGSINDILQFNEGRFKFVSHIDSSATFVTLDDSTKWIIKPDMRKEAKKWTKDDKVILGNTKTFIANPRTNQIAIVRQVK